MFKDEAGGLQVVEFVGLRAKLYAYLMDQGNESKKCKGIKKYVVQNSLTIDHFRDCLFNQQPQMRQMNVIRSHMHDVYSERVNKVALSHEDDKRIILEDKIHTLALHIQDMRCFIKYVFLTRLQVSKLSIKLPLQDMIWR